DGSSINFSDIFGTVNEDSCSATYFAPNGDFYIAGLTNSKSLTLVNPIAETSSQAPISIMLMKYSNVDLRFDYPVGKEKICPNSNLSIKWNSETFTNKDTFDIEIKTGSNDAWTPLAQKVVGFSYNWNIPPTFFADSAWLRISHLRGIVAKTPYPFTIYELPTIVESKSIPTNTTVCEGDSVILIMKGKGSNIKYQWLFNGSPIPGSTDTILIIKNINATTKGQYKGIISGPCPETVETPTFNVDFLPSTKILEQTKDTIVKASEKLVLFVYATGNNLSYQWYKDDERLIGANGSTFEILNVSKADEGIFKCKVAGTCGELFSQLIKVEVDTSVVPSKVDENLPISSYLLQDNILIINFYQKNEFPSFINIYNTLGQLVNPNLVRMEYSNAGISLNLENLQSGVYFVEFAANQKMYRLQVPVLK
ncbi:MAG: T9SS type A sorting domain-containing protein, partial [Candidatus Kapaibacteriota bacterium]